MKVEQTDIPRDRPERRWKRALILLAGIVATQVLLYGPSLIGSRILLPLDILASPNTYLPLTPAVKEIVPQDPALSDLVFMFEPARRFAASEIQAGRVPLWTTYQFAGSPFIWNSPFVLLGALTASPMVLAWVQLFEAIVAGLGAYCFFRRALGVSFWAGAIAAWCYPMTGFFILWLGYPTCGPVYWLPWLFLAVHQVVQHQSARWGAALSLVTCLVVVSGHIDVSAQALIGSGLFAIWCLFTTCFGARLIRQAARAILVLMLGWGLGLCLAAPYVLPLAEYVKTGARADNRSAGSEERPPVGLIALPHLVVPDCYGTTRRGSLPMFPAGEGNLFESSAAGYSGAIALLFAAPLAWCSRRHRYANLFWIFLGFLGVSWCLNMPGVVHLLRLPGLRMMSHNRLVFLTSFAVLSMSAIGLDVLRQRGFQWRQWFWGPALVMGGAMIWCFFKATTVPDEVGSNLETMLMQGRPVWTVHDTAGVREVQKWFGRTYYAAGLICGLGTLGWFLLWHGPRCRFFAMPAVGAMLIGDLLWFAHGHSAQCDPALYYPRIPALEQIASSPPGRVFGYKCLPATLAQSHGLSDVRGYDSIDPRRFIELMALAADPNEKAGGTEYAFTLCMATPLQLAPPDRVRMSPIFDLLGVRYVIFRGNPPEGIHPAFQSFDYWVLKNHAALPRAFVPARAEVIADRSERLQKLGAADFDPRAVAYLETLAKLPDACHGTAEIVQASPTRVVVSTRMETDGLVVLADLWDKGWHADLNGKEVPILRVNHALRGIVVPAGDSRLEFWYLPQTLVTGLWLSGIAALFLVGWLGIARLNRNRSASRENARVGSEAVSAN